MSGVEEVRRRVPPLGERTVADLYRSFALHYRTELLGGHFVRPCPQTSFHSLMVDLLVAALRACCPPAFEVERQMAVVLGAHDVLIPDVSVVRAEAVRGWGQDRFEAADLVLAVEVQEPWTRERDEAAKPPRYAAAGVPHVWQVSPVGPEVRTYAREGPRGYAWTGTYRERLRVAAPYPLDVDISRAALRRS
ncbi:Uma2 family endonuclease [Streptomyces sp. NPDC088923]|uniref:Uma2 family endonuclease n=1 Tax=Streptomyces sp. NPDC088923 TaxID=3365913 RepID=UPI003802B5E8